MVAPSRRERGAWILGALFLAAGTAHFLRPAFFLAMMPPWLPAHGTLVAVSGAAEIAGGLGVLWSPTRRAAGWGLVALLLAVFPANVQMLLNAVAAQTSTAAIALLVARLPLQPLLIWWVWRVAARAPQETATTR